MKNSLLCAVLIFLACFALSKGFAVAAEGVAAQNPAEMPEWAAMLPAETALVFVIEDVESFCDALFPLDPSKEGSLSLDRFVALVSDHDPKSKAPLEAMTAVVKTLLKPLRGSFCLGVGEKPEWPTFFFVGNVKPEAGDFAEFLSREVQPLFEPLGVESVLEKGDGVYRLPVGDFAVHLSTANSRLLASTDRASLLRMRDGKPPSESALAGQESFRQAAAIVAPEGLFVFADLKRLVRLHFGGLSSGTLRALQDLGFDRLESVALSVDIEDSFLKLKLAMTNDGKVAGIPEVILRPNTGIKTARFVPADYSVFMRLSVAGALDAYRGWQGIVRRLVDDVSWKEYQDSLAKLDKERGFALEDILENLGDEVAVAVKLPELIGIPPTLAFVSVKDEAKAQGMISRLLTKARAKPAVFSTVGGATIYTTTLVRGVFLSYTTKDGYLIIGLSPSSVASGLAASESGESLAELKGFKSALEAAPQENLLFAYADMGTVARFVAGLAHWFESSFQATFRSIFLDVKYSSETARIVQTLNLESERMGRAILCATGGDDYLLVQAEIPIGVIRALALPLWQPLAAAREQARRTACLSNLKQIVTACLTYAPDHKGRFPDKLSQLYPAYLNSLWIFSCPGTGTVISGPEEIDAKSSYRLIGGFVLKEVKRTGEKLVLYEDIGSHGEGANVAFADGHVKSVNREGFRKLIKEAGVQTNP